MGKQIHCPRKLAAPTRMGATHMVSILTHGGDTTPITSTMEGTPAGISNIVHITSVIEGLPRVTSIAPPPCLPSITTG